MPELPEVETIRLSLQKKIIGLTIVSVEILNPKSLIGDNSLLTDQKITRIWRRAKILGIELSNITLLFHLKMSGQIIFIGKERFVGGHPTQDMVGEMPNKSTRVIFTFSDGSKLYFNDQRKFGWVKVMDNEQLRIDNFLNKLGPEPLEKVFTVEVLKKNLLRHSSQPIKVALLDQSIIAGVGNIYASEACFNAGVDPRTRVSALSDDQIKKLHQGVIQALSDGIKYGGSTKTHFVDSDGKKGLFLDYAAVYNRDKKPCRNCGAVIQKIKLGGRGTFYCPNCQILPEG
jgi:formamidopyrimidine-DNA glycosylase